MTDSNYYQSELNRLKSEGYPISVKFFSDADNTRQLDLNDQSIPVIIEYLKSLLKDGE